MFQSILYTSVSTEVYTDSGLMLELLDVIKKQNKMPVSGFWMAIIEKTGLFSRVPPGCKIECHYRNLLWVDVQLHMALLQKIWCYGTDFSPGSNFCKVHSVNRLVLLQVPVISLALKINAHHIDVTCNYMLAAELHN